MTHLRRAIEELRAVRYGRGRYAYWADEIRALGHDRIMELYAQHGNPWEMEAR